MKKSERAKFIENRLDELYGQPEIPLNHRDPFTFLVAVVLSAQCTDERVNKTTPDLFKLADSPEKMAKLSVARIEKIIKPCGLSPQKSKAIKKLSQIIATEHGGQVPDTFEELEALPGVGHKTASVVMAQVYGVPAFPVDTHIHRLAQRWGLTNGQSVKKTEQDLKRLFPKEAWNRLHLQIIYYGREFCSARGCDGTKCEICTTCYPKRKKPFVAKKP